MTAPVSSDLAWLDDLERAHAAATVKFPWRQDSGYGEDVLTADGVQFGISGEPADAALIVAAVNALPELIAELRKRDAALRAVLAKHVPWYELNGRRVDNLVTIGCDQHDCTGDDETPCPDAAEGGYHEVPGCAECRYVSEWDVEGYLLWPCPTVSALTAALSPESVTS